MVLLLEVMFTLSLYLLRCFEREIFINQISGSVYCIFSFLLIQTIKPKKYSTSCFVAVNTSSLCLCRLSKRSELRRWFGVYWNKYAVSSDLEVVNCVNYLGTTQNEEYVGALMNLWEAESEKKKHSLHDHINLIFRFRLRFVMHKVCISLSEHLV